MLNNIAKKYWFWNKSQYLILIVECKYSCLNSVFTVCAVICHMVLISYKIFPGASGGQSVRKNKCSCKLCSWARARYHYRPPLAPADPRRPPADPQWCRCHHEAFSVWHPDKTKEGISLHCWNNMLALFFRWRCGAEPHLYYIFSPAWWKIMSFKICSVDEMCSGKGLITCIRKRRCKLSTFCLIST